MRGRQTRGRRDAVLAAAALGARAGRVRVLLISASMGAGHDGAARALAERLREAGHHAEVRDFLDSGPLRIGAALRTGYELELRHAPAAYEATYRFWYRVPWLCPLLAALVAALTGRRVRRWVRDSGADVVVSTYPLATLCLGRLRARGRLPVPAVNFITDFGVHPLWVHRGMDLNLAVHPLAAEGARTRSGRPTVASGPVVSPAFGPATPGERATARRELGLADGERAILVVAGSWGVGSLEATWAAVAGAGRFTPVVVCGRDEGLRRRMATLAARSAGRSIVLGWTDRMPALMAACDALVENAGGLTSFEALRAGLPVVSFRPLAGHGKENTAAMARAGVSRLAATPGELVEALAALSTPGPARDAQVAAGQAMFGADGADAVLGAVSIGPGPLPVPAARRALALAGRTALAVAALAGLTWTGLTSGVEMAAAAGAGVAHPPPGNAPDVYVGVRLDRAELADPSVDGWLADEGATAVVDQATADEDPAAVRRLALEGVDVENGGRGYQQLDAGRQGAPMVWTRASRDAQAGRALAGMTREPVHVFVPGRRINAWDLVEAGEAGEAVVVPDHVLRPAPPDGPIVLDARGIYVIDGLHTTDAQLDALLRRFGGALATAGLRADPLAALR